MSEPKQSSLSEFVQENNQRGPKKSPKNGPKNRIDITDVAMDTSITNPAQDPVHWHKGHRFLFGFTFAGPQPTRGSDSLAMTGRYHTVPQATFEYPEEKAVVQSMPHYLKVWIKHPPGIKTAEQNRDARNRALRVAESIRMKHGLQSVMLVLEPKFSEHTVESKPLDKLVRPVVLEAPELAQEKLGLSINQTSHKGRVEWTGRKARDRVMTLEFLLDKGFDQLLGTMERLDEQQGQNVSLLNSIIKLLKPEPGEAQYKPEPFKPGNEVV